MDNKYTRPYKKAAKYFRNATVDVGISLDKVLKVGLDSSCLQNNTSLDYFWSNSFNSSLICIKKKKKSKSKYITKAVKADFFLSLYRKNAVLLIENYCVLKRVDIGLC